MSTEYRVQSTKSYNSTLSVRNLHDSSPLLPNLDSAVRPFLGRRASELSFHTTSRLVSVVTRSGATLKRNRPSAFRGCGNTAPRSHGHDSIQPGLRVSVHSRPFLPTARAVAQASHKLMSCYDDPYGFPGGLRLISLLDDIFMPSLPLHNQPFPRCRSSIQHHNHDSHFSSTSLLQHRNKAPSS